MRHMYIILENDGLVGSLLHLDVLTMPAHAHCTVPGCSNGKKMASGVFPSEEKPWVADCMLALCM